MATAQLPFSPLVTTNASNFFGTTSLGYIQGVALPDATSRNMLRSGTLNPTETLPMYGGVGIYELIPAAGADEQGCLVGRATSLAAQNAKQLTGFAVFNQGSAYLSTSSSPVPVVPSYGSVSYYRLLGSAGARVPLACAPSLAASLDGGIVTALVSWDFTNQQLVPYVAAYNANVMTNSVYTALSNTITFTTTSAHGVGVGNYFTVTGSTPAGYNGDFLAIAGTTGSTLVATSLTGSLAAISVEGTLSAGGGALAIKGIDSITTNGKSVVANANGGYSWQTGATIALVQF